MQSILKKIDTLIEALEDKGMTNAVQMLGKVRIEVESKYADEIMDDATEKFEKACRNMVFTADPPVAIEDYDDDEEDEFISPDEINVWWVR